MTKPSSPKSAKSQKAPNGARRGAPFGRSQQNRPPAHGAKAHDPKRSPSAKVKSIATKPRTTPPQPATPKTPGAKINRRAADRLREGYLWVYASDIESIQLPTAGDPPALLPVADSRGLLLGTALYSPASQIALRMVSREAVDEPQWLELLATRLRAAAARRKSFLSEQTDSCRLCFSEGDELPGLVVDKFGSLVIIQLLTKGLDSPSVREICVRVLREELAP